MSDFLSTPIDYLKGVGTQKGFLLKKEYGIHTLSDLLSIFPFRYVDRSKIYKIRELNEEMPLVQLKGKIIRTALLGEKFQQRFIALLKDDSGTLDLIWFQGAKWLVGKFSSETEYLVLGKPTLYKGNYNMAHPEVDALPNPNALPALGLQPVYPSTESLKGKGLDSKGIRNLMKQLISQIPGKIPEILPQNILTTFQLMPRETAFIQVHFPECMEQLSAASYRIKFEELLLLQLRLLKRKVNRIQNIIGPVFNKVGDYFNDFYFHHLPFPLTNAQKRVLKEIRFDMNKGKQMSRLLQGDVGSGKTVVALMTMLIALDNNYQCCLLAPTEILARQHFNTLGKMTHALGLNPTLLTGSTRQKEKRKIIADLKSGAIKIIIGTHALLEKEIEFEKLGLIIIDEQHRFGVAQRASIQAKANPTPHCLVMSATPIPRTLAMTLYGDLDISVIDELPPGRKLIITQHFTNAKRLALFGFMKEQIKEGRQIYVVYPLIEESEKLDLNNLMEGFDALSGEFPLPQFRISILHGRLDSEKKENEMKSFVKGVTQILVSTTVIEVGVDVPNASVMIIENAERFGLSQLHQLRGRVGRGASQSYCILMTGEKVTREGLKRVEVMCQTQNGFTIAEEDLKLRGAGDIDGTRQSGDLNLRLADLSRDQQILEKAREAAIVLTALDPDLQMEIHRGLHQALQSNASSKFNWSKIG